MHWWLQLLRPACMQWTLHAFYTSPSNYSLKCRQTIINGRPSSALISQEYKCFVKHTVVRPTPAPSVFVYSICDSKDHNKSGKGSGWAEGLCWVPFFRRSSWNELYTSWLCIWVWRDRCIDAFSQRKEPNCTFPYWGRPAVKYKATLSS